MTEATFESAYPLALRASEVRARAEVVRGGLPQADYEDLKQEGLAACWRALPQFDPSRASLRTFVELVVASRLLSLRRTRNCRPRLQPLDDHHCLASKRWSSDIELRADVRRTVASLAEGDRRLALALMEHNVADAGRQLGVARSTLYARIGAIRRQFAAAGLGRGVLSESVTNEAGGLSNDCR